MESIDEIMKREGLEKIEKPVETKPMVEPLREYDERGNCIHYKNSDGFEWWSEFDERGNEVHHKNSDGFESWREGGRVLKRDGGVWHLDGVRLEKKEQERDV